MNKFHPNLEKTTSSVLSVILLNLWYSINKTKELSDFPVICISLSPPPGTGFAPYPGLLPRSKPTYLFLRRQMVPTLCNMVVEQLSNQGGRGGGATYQQLVSRRNHGVVECFKMFQKGL